MKTWPIVVLLTLAASAAPAFAAQNTATAAGSKVDIPKYDRASEAMFKGTVEEVRDRMCPVSGGMGSHVVLRSGDGKTVEVHLATSQWVKMYELVLNKGDEIEVTGVKVHFEGVDTIFAREVKRGNDVYAFRDKDGKPVW